MRRVMALGISVLAALAATTAPAAEPTLSHALSIHGEPKYGPDFTHFGYVNPTAPKGGEMRRHAIGTFDSLHPFILKGVKAAGLTYLYDALGMQPGDEGAVEYGLIAESFEVPADRSWVIFTLRPEARFHDGEPIKVEDVIYSLETLKTKGHPGYRSYFGNIIRAEAVGERRVKFFFAEEYNNELPVIASQLPILPKHYWTKHDFEKTTLVPPLGSGPYRIESLEPGRSITWRRVEDYWARDLPANVGQFNIDTIRYDYYRDATIAFEAFKGGEYDVRSVHISKEWAKNYDFPAVESGLVRKDEIAHQLPTGMQAYVINNRREVFRDARVREALGYAFDFEWTNENLFYGAYTRTKSYFSNSELESHGVPVGNELALLEPFRDQLPNALFEQPFVVPATDGSGNIRGNLRTAIRLLEEAGWTIKDGALTHQDTGTVMQFEFLLRDPASERIVLAFARNLERLGITATARVVDTAQYQKRMDSFDFDITGLVLSQSLSPGNEQREYWSSEHASVRGSRNYAGIENPVVDALIEQLIAAPTRESLVDHTRALDRVLLWNHYVIPQYHIRAFRLAYWNKFDRPPVSPKYEIGLDTWWVDADKIELVDEARGEAN